MFLIKCSNKLFNDTRGCKYEISSTSISFSSTNLILTNSYSLDRTLDAKLTEVTKLFTRNSEISPTQVNFRTFQRNDRRTNRTWRGDSTCI